MAIIRGVGWRGGGCWLVSVTPLGIGSIAVFLFTSIPVWIGERNSSDGHVLISYPMAPLFPTSVLRYCMPLRHVSTCRPTGVLTNIVSVPYSVIGTVRSKNTSLGTSVSGRYFIFIESWSDALISRTQLSSCCFLPAAFWFLRINGSVPDSCRYE